MSEGPTNRPGHHHRAQGLRSQKTRLHEEWFWQSRYRRVFIRTFLKKNEYINALKKIWKKNFPCRPNFCHEHLWIWRLVQNWFLPSPWVYRSPYHWVLVSYQYIIQWRCRRRHSQRPGKMGGFWFSCPRYRVRRKNWVARSPSRSGKTWRSDKRGNVHFRQEVKKKEI